MVRNIKIITSLPNTEQWPEYLEEQATYYHRKKLKQDLLGAANIIASMQAKLEEIKQHSVCDCEGCRAIDDI